MLRADASLSRGCAGFASVCSCETGKFSRRLSVPQTTALALVALRPRLRLTRSEIAIHEFGRHRHHDQSKNPSHHTTGSKLAPRRVVLKFNLDTIHRSIMQTDGVSPDDITSMFAFFSNRLGCLRSIIVSVIGTLILLAILRSSTERGVTRQEGITFQHKGIKL